MSTSYFIRKVLTIGVLHLLLLSCTKLENNVVSHYNFHSATDTKSLIECFDIKEIDHRYFVDNNDLSDYLKFRFISDQKELYVKDIEPFNYDGITLFYIINYEEGWEIISSDKRTPVLLAKGEHGSFSMKDYENTPWGTWMFNIGIDVMNTRLYGAQESYEENENVRFWTLISNPETILGIPYESSMEGSVSEPSGHYELVSTYTRTNYDSVFIDHLTSTKWSQTSNNCNYYVPYRTDIPSVKSYAGCVAVAGAQMLYFLHYKFGVPSAIPDYAYCSGNINSYQMWQSGSSTTIWGQMNTYGNTYVAVLIANAGSCVNMDYGNEGSGAETEDLVDNFFGLYGINCSFSNYDTNAIRTQIINRRVPIIVRAGSYVLFDTWRFTHSFIIDAAEYTRNKTTYYYEWVYDAAPDEDVEQLEPDLSYTVESYSVNTVELVKMNWGWGGDFNEDSFSPGGDWALTGDNGHYNLQYRRKMISGFSPN